MTMRKEQTSALIEHATQGLEGIATEYSKALVAQKISAKLQIDIKNFMENLRSALDYMAKDIYEIIIKPVRDRAGEKTIDKIYFPYGKSENDFKSRIGACLPKLEILNSDIFSLIESMQPHKLKDDWLYIFCNIVNEKKHDNLTPQVKEVRRGLKIELPGGVISLGPNATISGGGVIKSGNEKIEIKDDIISGNSPAKHTTPGVRQTIIEWEAFLFEDTNIDVLPLLKKALQRINKLNESLYSKLDSH